jgi:hypothetical protein
MTSRLERLGFRPARGSKTRRAWFWQGETARHGQCELACHCSDERKGPRWADHQVAGRISRHHRSAFLARPNASARSWPNDRCLCCNPLVMPITTARFGCLQSWDLNGAAAHPSEHGEIRDGHAGSSVPSQLVGRRRFPFFQIRRHPPRLPNAFGKSSQWRHPKPSLSSSCTRDDNSGSAACRSVVPRFPEANPGHPRPLSL